MTVVKDVPLALNFYNASVIIAAVCEIAVGAAADGVAEFVTQN